MSTMIFFPTRKRQDQNIFKSDMPENSNAEVAFKMYLMTASSNVCNVAPW